jgi:hypothetical protein
MPGHATTLELLEACVEVTGSDAELVWVDEADLAAAGAQPWTQLPCWVPETGEAAGVFEGDVSKALGAGLVVRPVEQTVADTWAWVQEAGVPKGRPGMEPGLPRSSSAPCSNRRMTDRDALLSLVRELAVVHGRGHPVLRPRGRLLRGPAPHHAVRPGRPAGRAGDAPG